MKLEWMTCKPFLIKDGKCENIQGSIVRHKILKTYKEV